MLTSRSVSQYSDPMLMWIYSAGCTSKVVLMKVPFCSWLVLIGINRKPRPKPLKREPSLGILTDLLKAGPM